MPASIACIAQTTCELAPLAPFDFDSTFHKPDHFPSNDNRWVPGIRWQTMIWHALPLGLKFENCGSLDQPRVALTIWSLEPLASAYLTSLRTEIVFRYNLALDLNPFYRRFAADPLLGPVCTRWRGLRPSSYSSLYEYLVIAIVLQNATVRRSVQMLRNLFEHYGAGLAYDGQ